LPHAISTRDRGARHIHLSRNWHLEEMGSIPTVGRAVVVHRPDCDGQAIGMPLDLPVRATLSHAKTVRATPFGHALGTTGVDKVVRVQCPLADEDMRDLRPLGSVGAVHRAEAPAHPAGRTLTSTRACEAPRRRVSLCSAKLRSTGALEASTHYAIRVCTDQLAAGVDLISPAIQTSRLRSGGVSSDEMKGRRGVTRRQPPYLGETSQRRVHARVGERLCSI
jgi:hypothetical protein